MKKKIIGITLVLAFAALLIAPVMANPTQGQKVEVTLQFIFPPISRITVDEWYSNGVMHRLRETLFNVELTITEGPTTLYGTASAERKSVRIMPKGKDTGKVNIVDYYVFDFGAGGFEGNGKVMLDGFVPGPPGSWEDVLGVGLFHGTGTFEGQTLNIMHQWGDPPNWSGYWLKYQA